MRDSGAILWRRVDVPGHESARVFRRDGRWHLEGAAVFAEDGKPCRLDYRIVCDEGWRTVSASVSGWVGGDEVRIEIAADESGRWRMNGAEQPQVEGCVDVDLNFSPSTNLLPIRRLGLAVGEEAPVAAAWLRFPSFALERFEQTYRRNAISPTATRAPAAISSATSWWTTWGSSPRILACGKPRPDPEIGRCAEESRKLVHFVVNHQNVGVRMKQIPAVRRHKVFISYHHAGDEEYKTRLIKNYGEVFDNYSVSPGDIEDNITSAAVRQEIRDSYIRGASVTIVLVGNETWKRKHVDWEIHASLRDTFSNDRKGLLGLLVPTYKQVPGLPVHETSSNRAYYTANNIPPRLWVNVDMPHPFAVLRPWPQNSQELLEWIHEAYIRRSQEPPPRNSLELFGKNRSGDATHWVWSSASSNSA